MVEPQWPKSKMGRPPFAIETMLRIHYLQQWFGLSDPAMEEALHDIPITASLPSSMECLIAYPTRARPVNRHGAFADAGYQGGRAQAARGQVRCELDVAIRLGKRKALDLNDSAQAITDKIERIKASIRFGSSRGSLAM